MDDLIGAKLALVIKRVSVCSSCKTPDLSKLKFDLIISKMAKIAYSQYFLLFAIDKKYFTLKIILKQKKIFTFSLKEGFRCKLRNVKTPVIHLYPK